MSLVGPKDQSCPERFTPSSIHKMKFLRCCIKESLRLFPVVPFIARQVNLDSSQGPSQLGPIAHSRTEGQKLFKVKGLEIPHGTLLFPNLYAVQRNPKHWSRPEEFVPERFADEAIIVPYAYAPFLGGKRICPGVERAYTYLTIVMASLLREFRWESEGKVGDIKPKFGVLFNCEQALNVKFSVRQTQGDTFK